MKNERPNVFISTFILYGGMFEVALGLIKLQDGNFWGGTARLVYAFVLLLLYNMTLKELFVNDKHY